MIGPRKRNFARMSTEKLTALLETASQEDTVTINAILATRKETEAETEIGAEVEKETIILSKFAMLIELLRKRVDCKLVYGYVKDSSYEVIAILSNDALSDFAYNACVENQGSNIEARVEVLDVCEHNFKVLDAREHNFKVKITCKSK